MKRKLLVAGFVLLAVLLGVYVGYNAGSFYQALFSSAIADSIFYSAAGGEAYYSIVNSRTEVLRVNLNGTRTHRIVPQRETSACINGVLVDEAAGKLYIWCTFFDETGSYIAREEILRYTTAGRFEDTVYVQEHRDEDAVPVSGRIRSLSRLPGGLLGVAYTTDDEIHTFELDGASGQVGATHAFEYENASHAIYDIDMAEGITELVFSSKEGRIYAAAGGAVALLYDVGPQGIFVPSRVVNYQGGVLVRESFRGQVLYIGAGGAAPQLVLQAADDDLSEITSFDLHGDSLTIGDNTGLRTYTLAGAQAQLAHTVERLNLSLPDRALNWLVLLLILACLVVLIAVAGRMFKRLADDSRHIFKQAVIICAGLTVSVAIISYYVFTTLDERTEEANYNLLSIHMEYLTQILDTEKVEQLNNVAQFGSEDFLAVVDQLNQALTVNGEQDYSKYIGIMKYIEGKTVILTYQDMDEFYFTPVFSEYQEDGMYLPTFETGAIRENISDDAEGRWQYIFGPIRNAGGEIIALAEIGFDLTPYEESNSTLFTNLVLQLITILVVIMLLFVEFTIFDSKVLTKKRLTHRSEEDEQSISAGSVRLVCVALFIGAYLNATFMPVYSDGLYADILGLPRDVVVAMPIFTESVFLIISILLFGRLKRKINFKNAILAGGVVFAAGNLLTASATSSLTLVLTRALSGLGYGIVYIALRAYIAAADKKFAAEELIAYGAGMTCGVCVGGVVGSIVVDFIGYRNAFYVVALVILGASLLAWRLLNTRYAARHTRPDAEPGQRLSTLRFLMNKDVIVYYLCEFLPSAVCGSFLLYFLPLLAARLGYSTTLVGQIFLLNALFAIYSGPVLTRLTSRCLGSKKSLVLAAFIYSAAIFLMAFNTGSMFIAAVTAIIVGVTDSFKENHEADYFLSMDVSRRVGETRAVSFFGIFECTGEAIGPLMYGIILSLSMSSGLMILGASLPLTIGLFALNGSRRARRRQT